MPPKGGNTSLSDAQVKGAVEYMVQKAGLMEASASAPAAEPAQAKESEKTAEAAQGEEITS